MAARRHRGVGEVHRTLDRRRLRSCGDGHPQESVAWWLGGACLLPVDEKGLVNKLDSRGNRHDPHLPPVLNEHFRLPCLAVRVGHRLVVRRGDAIGDCRLHFQDEVGGLVGFGRNLVGWGLGSAEVGHVGSLAPSTSDSSIASASLVSSKSPAPSETLLMIRRSSEGERTVVSVVPSSSTP